MDNSYGKKIIKEDKVPGLDVTKKVNKETGKYGKSYYKEIKDKIDSYNKALNKSDKNSTPVKFNYNDNSEEDYHKEMEIMNGQEMIQYDREPNKIFKDRAKEAIEGSSKMGNNPEWANVIPKQQGFTGPEFGKNLVKTIEASQNKRNKQTPTTKMFGDDWEVTEDKSHKPYAFENISEGKKDDKEYKKGVNSYKYFIVNIKNNKVESGWEFEPDAKDALSDFDGDKNYKIMTEKGLKNLGIESPKNKWLKNESTLDKNTNKKEKMKRLIFKKPFNGYNNALKMIPESYKVDNKTFEITDGNETYQVRWEGSLNEGKGIILTASNKLLVNEEVNKMMHLMGYKSEKTLGLLKGNQRLDENKIFENIWDTTKSINSSDTNQEDDDLSNQIMNESMSDKSDIYKFVFFSYNFPHNFIEDIWGNDTTMGQHLKGKWDGNMSKFYTNLDDENRNMLENYITNVFYGENKTMNEGDVDNTLNYMNGNEQLKAKLKTLNSSSEIIEFVVKFVESLTKGDETMDSKVARAIKGDDEDVNDTTIEETNKIGKDMDRFDEVFYGLDDEDDMDEGIGNVLNNINSQIKK